MKSFVILTRDLKVDWCQSNLYLMLKQLLLFYKFFDFFCRQHSQMSQPCWNNLFQFMQHNNFWNLNALNCTHWKHLESRVNAIWYCFRVIKWSFTICRNRLPFQEIREYSERFWSITIAWIWRYQSLVILCFISVAILIYDESDSVCFV